MEPVAKTNSIPDKMVECCEYRNLLTLILTKAQYMQYLDYLKLLKNQYLSEKVLYYATVAFKVFFPADMKCVLDNYDMRKSLFIRSKCFVPKADRAAYMNACNELTKRMDENVKAYLSSQSQRVQKGGKRDLTEEARILIESNDGTNNPLRLGRERTKKQVKFKPENIEACMICFEKYNISLNFAEAKCGHVACWNCWAQWLDKCLECPMCKQRTRLKQLEKIDTNAA